MPSGREGSRVEWERIRQQGLARYLLVRGVLLRGIPMALVIILALELFKGRSIDRELLLDKAFEWRLWVAAGLFSLGGVIASFARWKMLDASFGTRPDAGGS